MSYEERRERRRQNRKEARTLAPSVRSYSQAAEDLLAALYLRRSENITYVDVGCCFPADISNTYFFYERGGAGVCIDPNPDLIADFAEIRPRDTFVNSGVSNKPGNLTYYRFNKNVFNTFCKDRYEAVVAKGKEPIDAIAVPVNPLTDILAAADWRNRFGANIDLLTVDVEGFEWQVISSLDLNYARPRLVVMEMCVKTSADNFQKACDLLTGNNYNVVGQTGHDIFFKDQTSR
jgi:FkbM family methyltransferase